MPENSFGVGKMNTSASEMEDMYLNFSVGKELYGIEIQYILQIIGMQEITEMPEMPYGMKGFINLRGSVIPVVSMRTRFGKNDEEYHDRTCIVVVQVGEKQIGLIVDAIQETITIDPENISPQPTTGEEISYIRGIAHLSSNRTAVIICIQKLFADSNY
jgi:purine-binding chemotaxis protein CheW